MTQSVCVRLLLSLIRQEVVPSDVLKTQEVDINMPGIPALCSLYRDKKELCIAYAHYVHDINVLQQYRIATYKHACTPHTHTTLNTPHSPVRLDRCADKQSNKLD